MNLFINHITWQRYNKLLFNAKKINKNIPFLTWSTENPLTREKYFPSWGKIFL